MDQYSETGRNARVLTNSSSCRRSLGHTSHLCTSGSAGLVACFLSSGQRNDKMHKKKQSCPLRGIKGTHGVSLSWRLVGGERILTRSSEPPVPTPKRPTSTHRKSQFLGLRIDPRFHRLLASLETCLVQGWIVSPHQSNGDEAIPGLEIQMVSSPISL